MHAQFALCACTRPHVPHAHQAKAATLPPGMGWLLEVLGSCSTGDAAVPYMPQAE